MKYPEPVEALREHISLLAAEIRSLQKQVKAQDKFILWQAERIVELEQGKAQDK